MIQDLTKLVLDVLFPIQCLNCHQEGLFLCVNCQNRLQLVSHQICVMCRKPNFGGQTHGKCLNSQTPQALISIFDYKDPVVSRAVIWGKYKFLPDIYRLLGRLMARHLEGNYDYLFKDAVLCPIPLSDQRLRWRGFNQAEILTQAISNYFAIPTLPLIARRKNTKTQKDLSKAERLQNMHNGFRLTAAPPSKVILIDDVVTTGATLHEATRHFAQSEVYWLTLARD